MLRELSFLDGNSLKHYFIVYLRHRGIFHLPSWVIVAFVLRQLYFIFGNKVIKRALRELLLFWENLFLWKGETKQFIVQEGRINKVR
jgi:hypothetical protein